MSRISIALRIARRTSARSTARSALIVAMIALPIAGMSAVAIVGTSMTPTTAETISTKLGGTQALIQAVGTAADGVRQVPDRPEEFEWVNPGETTGYSVSTPGELFAGRDFRVIPSYPTNVGATTSTGFSTFSAVEGEVWDASFAGRFDTIAGREPVRDDEVMVTPATLDRLGLDIGDTVELRNASIPNATIVGTLDDQSVADSVQRFFGRTGAFTAIDTADRAQNTTYYVPTEVLDWADVEQLNSRGAVVLSRSVLLDPPAPASDIKTARDPDFPVALFAIAGMIGVFAAFEVVLLAGAAFTVTARQQQRTLATIASAGATTSTLRGVVTASGLVLGAIGGVLGTVVGIGGAAAFMAFTADGSRRQYFAFHVPWPLLAAVAIFAIIVGLLAALAPARMAARLDVVAALRGSRRPPTPSARRPVIGLVLLISGISLTLVGGVLMSLGVPADESPFATDGTLKWLPPTLLAAGPVLALVGLIACGPLLLRIIARLLHRGSIPARLASRDAARNPGRSVPAIAVTMTTVFIAVVAMNLISSYESANQENWSYRVAEGEIEVPLDNSYSYTGQNLTPRSWDAANIERAVRASVDLDEVAILSSVHEPTGLQNSTASPEPGLTYPFVAIPAENACNDDGNNRGDWRCESSFVDPGSSGIRDRITIGDARGLELVLGHTPSGDALETLANGGVISFYRQPVADGTVTIDWWSAEQVAAGDHYTLASAPQSSISATAVVELPDRPYYFGVFMAPATADALGLEASPSLLLASTTTPITSAQEDALMFNVASAKPGLAANEAAVMISRGPEPVAQAWAWGLLALSALIALAAAGVAIGLARFDGRQDDATLSSLGAARLVRRNFAFWQGIVLIGTGSLLGATLGIVPSVALGQGDFTPFAPAWPQIGMVVVVLPLLIAAGNWMLASTRAWTPRVAGD